MKNKDKKILKNFEKTLHEFEVARELFDENKIDKYDDEIYLFVKENIGLLRMLINEYFDKDKKINIYTQFLGHCGMKKMEELIRKGF